MTRVADRLAAMSPEKREYILGELCRHLLRAGRHEESAQWLSNLGFLAQRCAFDGVDAVIADMEGTRSALGPNTDAEFEEIARFVNRRSHVLRTDPAGMWQEALNCDEPRIVRAAQEYFSAQRPGEGVWLRNIGEVGEERHSGAVVSLLFWNGDLVVSTTSREVWLWDLESGRVRWRYDAPPSPAKSLEISPDGRRLAAAFGTSEPSPLISGIRVWLRSGGTSTTAWLPHWAYSVRWVADDTMVVGGGFPRGADSTGRIWRLNVDSGYRTEIGGWIADKPIVLAWELGPPNTGSVMAVSKDGYLLRIDPDYVPIQPAELEGVSKLVMSDEDWVKRDLWMEKRRPVVTRVAAPAVDHLGLLSTATVGPDKRQFTMLGEPPIIPEMAMLHHEQADGVYHFDVEQGVYVRIPFGDHNLKRGFQALCIDVSPRGDVAAVGVQGCYAYLVALREGTWLAQTFQEIHDGDAPVTGVRFDETGDRLAVGDSTGQITVYELIPAPRRIFTTAPLPRAIKAGRYGRSTLVLFSDHLAITDTGNTETVSWDDDVTAVDFAVSGSVIVVLLLPARSRRPADSYAQNWMEYADLLLTDTLRATTYARLSIPNPRFADGDKLGSPYRRVALRRDHRGCSVYLTSAHGVWEDSLLAPRDMRFFTIPQSQRDRGADMRVIPNYDADRPDLQCLQAVLTDDSEWVMCPFRDNGNTPLPSGELHAFALETGSHEEVMRFPGSVTDACSRADTTIVGTDDGIATAIRRRPGGWERLGIREHDNSVVAVTLSRDGMTAVSASRDGEIVAWRTGDRSTIVGAFIDAEPMAVSLDLPARRLHVIDIFGREYAWDIVGEMRDAPALANPGVNREHDLYLEALEVIARARSKGSRSALHELPNVPDRAEIADYWAGELNDEAP